MCQCHIRFACLMIILVMSPGPAAEPRDLKFANVNESKSEYTRSVEPVLAQHCFSCHDSKNAAGDLDLTALDTDMQSSTSGARWAMVVEKLSTGEMPPRGKPRLADRELVSIGRWAHAEAKRAGRPFTRRSANANGNTVPHHLLFDPKNVSPFDGGSRIRRLSPQIYAAFTNDLAKGKSGVGQPFSPEGKTTFLDMDDPAIDEPVTVQLLTNALLIAEAQTAHKIEGGSVKAVGQGVAKPFLRLFDPKSPPTDSDFEAAIVHQFTTVLRRPPTAEETTRFVDLMKKNIAEAGLVVGVRYTLATVLLLPEAVFRLEVGSGQPDARGRVRLTPREIAFALAYALTDRRPDADLLQAAATGKLDTDEGVSQQVRRILDSPKLDKPRILRFFREYFGYDRATEVFKENLKEFGYDANVLIADADALVLSILDQDREVLRELLTTNKGFVNVRLDPKNSAGLKEYHSKNNRKTHLNYSLPADWQWTKQQPIQFPRGQRLGILTHPSWLIAHSTSFDNHVIHRGKWIRERLLGGVVPDVPITVEAQLPDAPHQTLRERVEVTRQEYCWKCHRLMNDLGLPFEQYDHLGRFRTAESVLDPDATAANRDKKGNILGPVYRMAILDTRGSIAFVPDPSLMGPVSSPQIMMEKLASSEYVEQVFVRYAFRYWLGRNETPGDAHSLQTAHAAYRRHHGSMKSLIIALLSSESFLYRVPTVSQASRDLPSPK